MKYFRLFCFLLFTTCTLTTAQEFFGPDGESDETSGKSEVPEPLRPWIDWTLKGTPDAGTPRSFEDAEIRLPLWTSRLQLNARADGADFTFDATAFDPAWLGLPGNGRTWPTEVQLNGKPVPVVERNGRPAIHLPKGSAEVIGALLWKELPQQIALPPEIGLLALTVNGSPQDSPSWDSDGTLWLQRDASSEPVDEDFLSIKMHSLLEDGIPLWFETRIELIVAGKSREETLGSVLPEGWQLAKIQSPIPVAIDESGLLKAQLRAGRWSILLRAFQTSEVAEIGFAEGSTPAVADQVLAFRAQPSFRQAEIMGLPQIDVAQTQVPEEWRSLPVYRWETDAAFQLVERVRGPGERGAAPLSIQRSLWLDDDGKMLTYQDRLSGRLSEIRRLDAAEAHQLGSVTVGGEPQLITHDPNGGAPGFEVRAPNLEAVATGRIEIHDAISATGWQTNADDLKATLHLSPGYRLFALFGADYTRGDWLTSWTLLDLFLLLLFTLAVFRMRGFRGALIALIAFGLAYHEPGAPRFPWLLLLIPVALLDSVTTGRWMKWIVMMKWGAIVILVTTLAPFAAYQIQGALFPQLERKTSFQGYPAAAAGSQMYDRAGSFAENALSSSPARASKKDYAKMSQNLKADPKAIIQTGPGVPAWTWRSVEFGFDGPVDQSQVVRPVLIPPTISRLLGVIRVLALVLLAALLLMRRKKKKRSDEPTNGPAAQPGIAPALLAAGLVLFAAPGETMAQFPNAQLLDELRSRLVEVPEGFPGAVEIANAAMTIDDASVELALDYHAAARAAAPVPFPIGAMEPMSAQFEDGTPATLLRQGGQLWVLLPEPGIHRITVSGKLRNRSDWEWGFALKPRRLSVDAPGWTVSGVRPDGSAEDQVLFAHVRQEGGVAATANYDRPTTNHAILVERQIELGLVWRVTTTVSRLSPKGRAAALRVPLLTGEKVVSAGRSVKGGAIEIRLAPDADSVSWEGELSPANELALSTPEKATWTERWRLVASPVWNVSFSGLAPVFIVSEDQLIPLWQPWPGESATITVSRPQAVEGAAVTIDSAHHSLTPGRRQRSAKLTLNLRTSLGEDFSIGIPPDAEVTTLQHDERSIPIRKEGDAIVVPLRPGPQSIAVEWRLPDNPGGWTRVDAVTLPVESANVQTSIRPSQDRWLILTDGPLRGPAVRFWSILAFAIIASLVLARLPHSPLRIVGWILLSLGLTQISVTLSLIIIAWLFLVHFRDEKRWKKLRPLSYNFFQVGLIVLTLVALGIFIRIASVGLLGDPEMYVAGNGSSSSLLNWFSARAPQDLPRPGYWSISIWWFRLAMLLWALWLAYSLVGWLRNGWKNSAARGHFQALPKRKLKTIPKKGSTPPDMPDQPKPDATS